MSAASVVLELDPRASDRGGHPVEPGDDALVHAAPGMAEHGTEATP